MGIQKREAQREQPSQTKNQEEKMALNINSFSPFSMRAPMTIPSSATDGTTTGWSPAGTSTTPSRSSGSCSTRRRPRWRRATPGWRSGSTPLSTSRRVEGLRAIRKTSRGRKARGEEGGRQRLHPEELLKELHIAQGG